MLIIVNIVALIIATLKKLEKGSFLVSLFSNKGRLKKVFRRCYFAQGGMFEWVGMEQKRKNYSCLYENNSRCNFESTLHTLETDLQWCSSAHRPLVGGAKEIKQMAVVNHRHKTGEDLKWAVTMEFMKKVGRSPQIYTVPKKMTAHFVVGCPTGTNIFYIALRYQEVTFICNYMCGYLCCPLVLN